MPNRKEELKPRPFQNRQRRSCTGALNDKLQDFQKAVNAVLGIRLIARTDDATAVPGEKEPLTLHFYNRGPEKIAISKASLSSPGAKGRFVWSADQLEGKQLAGGSSASARLSFDNLAGSKLYRTILASDQSTDARYKILPTQNEFAPFGPSEIAVEVRYLFQGIEIPVHAHRHWLKPEIRCEERILSISRLFRRCPCH